jgi:hypothetical protein
MEIRESAPLCLARGSGRGGAVRGWARIGADITMRASAVDVKQNGDDLEPAPRA